MAFIIIALTAWGVVATCLLFACACSEADCEQERERLRGMVAGLEVEHDEALELAESNARHHAAALARIGEVEKERDALRAANKGAGALLESARRTLRLDPPASPPESEP